MKYFVPIDRKSIVKNPNAGSTQTIQRTGKAQMRFTCKTLPKVFTDGLNVLITSVVIGDGKDECIGIIMDPDILKNISAHSEYGLEISVEYQHHVFHHPPEKTWFYKYKTINIKCVSCGSKIKTTDLKTETILDIMGDEYYSDRTCPKCGTYDCCQLEYESIHSIKN